MPWDRSKYPKNWPAIVEAVRARSGNRCECSGECGRVECQGRRCEAVNHQAHPISGSRVVLTTAHLNHEPACADLEQLRHLCQRCHLHLDRHHHAKNARATLSQRRRQLATDAGQGELPGVE